MTYRVQIIKVAPRHRGHSIEDALEVELNALPEGVSVVSVEHIASLYFRVVTAAQKATA